MIKMSMGHEDRVHLRMDMTHSIVDSRNVRLNARTKRNAQQIHSGKVRIDKQRVAFEFEFVTVRAEISRALSLARSCGRIAHNQVRVTIKSTSKRLGRQHEK